MKPPLKPPELLAPAGTVEQVQAATLYGADAVYLGGASSLRASRAVRGQALHEARHITQVAGVSLYYCCNAFPRPRQWREALSHLEEGAGAGVDAFIIADAGVLSLARRHFPHIPVHLSTQANTCNAGSVAFWATQGVSRVNLARELRLSEVRDIRRTVAEECPDMELECFVHGAQCLAISGQCLLSAWLNGRPANAGQCTQPCRFEYRPMPGRNLELEESLRSGETLWGVTQEEDFSALWAPEDLCLLFFVPWMARQGITALKIEGRMRSGAYAAHVLDVYRQALNLWAGGQTDMWKDSKHALLAELAPWSGRPLGTGFFVPHHQVLAAAPARGTGGHSPALARLEEEKAPGVWRVSVRGQWQAQRDVCLVLPGMRRPVLAAGQYGLENHRGERVDVVHSGMPAVLHCAVEGMAELVPGLYVECIGLSG